MFNANGAFLQLEYSLGLNARTRRRARGGGEEGKTKSFEVHTAIKIKTMSVLYFYTSSGGGKRVLETRSRTPAAADMEHCVEQTVPQAVNSTWH